jgi:hypothetical protein
MDRCPGVRVNWLTLHRDPVSEVAARTRATEQVGQASITSRPRQKPLQQGAVWQVPAWRMWR